MHLRSFIGLGLLLGGLMLAISCSGPSPEAADTSGKEVRSRVYHVRLEVTKKKEQANQILGQALEWWKTHASAIAPRPLSSADDPPVSVVWRAPLYRVQIGAFASRAQADSVLQIARSTFPDAFVSPEPAGSVRLK